MADPIGRALEFTRAAQQITITFRPDGRFEINSAFPLPMQTAVILLQVATHLLTQPPTGRGNGPRLVLPGPEVGRPNPG